MSENIQAAPVAEQQVQEVQQQVVEPAKTAEEARKYKFKFKDQEVEWDEKGLLNNADELIKLAQLGKLGHTASQEAAELRKLNNTMRVEVQEFLEVLKKDPISILKDKSIGADLKNIARQLLAEQAEEESKSPDQKRLEDLEQQLSTEKAEKVKLRKEKDDAEKSRLEHEKAKEYEGAMIEAMKDYEVEDPYFIAKAASYILAGLDAGVDLTPKDVMGVIMEEQGASIKRMAAKDPDKFLDKWVGKDVLDGHRKRRVQEAKKSQIDSISSAREPSPAPEVDKKIVAKAASSKDFFKNLSKQKF